MKSFRTPLSPIESEISIDHQTKILSIGSCFAARIGERLAQKKFNTLLNPFGILYNPVSICKALNRLDKKVLSQPVDLFEHLEQWHSFDHHSDFSALEQKASLDHINEAITEGHSFLKKTSVLIITLGTANVFWHKKNEQVVANCHKLPNTDFERKSLTVEAIVNDFEKLFQQLLQQQTELKIILTVSPVRHIRDGLIENQRSKAKLLLATEALCQKFESVIYFPAYELLLDDLRDYRFYDNDMIHPNETAVDYIWDFFQDTFFSENTKALNQKIDQVVSASLHRPFNPSSLQHQAFVNNQLEKIRVLEEEFSFLSFEKEIGMFREQLKIRN